MSQVIPSEIMAGAKIKVVGVGGGGGSSVKRMVDGGLKGVEFVVVNTDAQALANNPADIKVNIGKQLTRGLGAGANPDVGRRAAEESSEDISESLKGSDMVFITYGLGGGTGTGAGPVVADIAKQSGALTVAVVTLPFSFEGAKRRENADKGLEAIFNKVDSILVIPNDKIFEVVDKKTRMDESFKIIDDVLFSGVQGISDIITNHGAINIDFADVRTIMQSSGIAMMGTGTGQGENRAKDAVNAAMNSPLLEVSIDGAKGVLINFTAGNDVSVWEVQEAADIVHEAADAQAQIIWGLTMDEKYQGQVKVTIVATGFEKKAIGQGPSNFSNRQKQETQNNPFSDFNRPQIITPQNQQTQAQFPQAQRGGQFGGRQQQNQFFGNLNPNAQNLEEDPDTPAYLRKRG